MQPIFGLIIFISTVATCVGDAAKDDGDANLARRDAGGLLSASSSSRRVQSSIASKSNNGPSDATNATQLPCANGVTPATSNTVYVLHNCTLCDAVMRVDAVATWATTVWENVTIIIEGGCVVPSIVIDQRYIHRVVNVSVVIRGVVVSDTSAAFGLRNPVVSVQSPCSQCLVDEVAFLTVAVIDSTLVVHRGDANALFVSVMSTNMSDVSMLVQQSQILGTADSKFQYASLFQIYADVFVERISVSMSNANVSLTSSASFSNYIVDLLIGYALKPFAAGNNISVVFSHACHVSLTITCLNVSDMPFGCAVSNGTSNSLVRLVSYSATITNVLLLSRDSVLSTVVFSQRLSRFDHSSYVFSLEKVPILRHVNVTISGGSAVATATRAARVVSVSMVNSITAYVVIHVSTVMTRVRATKAIYSSGESSRSVAVVYVTATQFSRSSVVVTNVSSTQMILSGTEAEAALSSTLLSVTSDILYADAGMDDVIITVANCTMWSDIRNGTIPLITFPLPLMFASVSTSLIRFYKTYAMQNATVQLLESTLYVFSGFTLASALGATDVVLVTMTVALLFPLVNCSRCGFVISNSTCFVQGMDYPSQLSQRSVAGGGSVVRHMFNMTMVFVAFDMGEYIDQMGGAILTMFRLFPFFKVFSLPVFHSNVTLVIEGSTMSYPLPPSNDATVNSRLLAMIPRPLDVLGYVGYPNVLIHATIRLVVPLREASTTTTLVHAVSPVHAQLCIFGCNMTDVHATITTTTTASSPSSSALVVATLFSCLSGAVRLVDSSMVFTTLIVQWPVMQSLNGGQSSPQQVDSLLSIGAPAPLLIGVNGATLRIDSRSSLLIDHCQFHDFSPNVLIPRANVTWRGGGTSTSTGVAAVAPILTLGCNLWNGEPLSPQLVRATIPRNCIGFHSDMVWNQSLMCEGRFLETRTQTTTAELQQEPIGVMDLILDGALPSSSAWTAGVSVAAALGATLGGGAAVAAVDSQVLGAMGSSVCASSALRVAAGPTRYTLSPFASLGPAAMIFGNVGLVLVCIGIQLMAIRCMRFRVKSSNEEREDKEYDNHAAPPPSRSCHRRGGGGAAVAAAAEIRVQFPNHSYTLALLLAQGVANASAASMFQGDDVGLVICGCCGAVVLGVAAYIRSRWLLRPVEALFVFESYRRSVRRSFFLSEWLLPIGRWGNNSLRATHGRLRGAVRGGGSETFALFVFTVALVQNALLGLPVRTSWCGALWGILCVVSLLAAIIVAWRRPSRIPIVDVFSVVSYVLQSILFLLNLLLMSINVQEKDDGGAGRILAGISAVALIVSVIAIVRGIHACWVTVWEQRRSETSSVVYVSGADRDADLQQSFDRFFLKNADSSVTSADGGRGAPPTEMDEFLTSSFAKTSVAGSSAYVLSFTSSCIDDVQPSAAPLGGNADVGSCGGDLSLSSRNNRENSLSHLQEEWDASFAANVNIPTTMRNSFSLASQSSDAEMRAYVGGGGGGGGGGGLPCTGSHGSLVMLIEAVCASRRDMPSQK